MGVIEFPWRLWFFVDGGQTVINQWLNGIEAPEPDRAKLRALLDIYKFNGMRAIASVVEDIGDELFAIVSRRKGGLSLGPIFCRGPFSDTEITFLQGAVWKGEAQRPYSAKGSALENLEQLRIDHRRRRYERISAGT